MTEHNEVSLFVSDLCFVFEVPRSVWMLIILSQNVNITQNVLLGWRWPTTWYDCKQDCVWYTSLLWIISPRHRKKLQVSKNKLPPNKKRMSSLKVQTECPSTSMLRCFERIAFVIPILFFVPMKENTCYWCTVWLCTYICKKRLL